MRGAARQVEAYPPGLEEKNRAEHDAPIMALTPVLGSINLQSDDNGPEYRALWSQLNAIKGKLCSLRGEKYTPPPCPRSQPLMASLRAAPFQSARPR